MTDIPGTGNLKNSQAPIIKDEKPEEASVVNVQEIIKTEKISMGNHAWHDSLKFWILIGSGIGVIFALFAILNWRFLLLTPLSIITSIASWYIRKLTKKVEDKKYPFK